MRELLVAGHADAAVGRSRLLHQGAGVVAVAGRGSLEQHLGVEPAGLGALELERELLGLAQGRAEVLLGEIPLSTGGRADAGDPLEQCRTSQCRTVPVVSMNSRTSG